MVMTYSQSNQSNREDTATAKDRMKHLLTDAMESTRDVRDQNALAAEMRILETVEVGVEAEEIIEKLKTVEKDSPKHIQRRVIHYFESLVDLDRNAFHAIRVFLNTDQELEYLNRLPGTKNDAPLRKGSFMAMVQPLPNIQQLRRPEFIMPQSMRLGMFEALYRIGGLEAEAILVEVLKTTARGIEVAHIDSYLSEMAPDKYVKPIVEAAYEILHSPPDMEDPSPVDKLTKAYLFAILVKYNDQRLIDLAKVNILDESGRLGATYAKYLVGALKADALPILFPLYRDNRLVNKWDRRALREMTIPYVGYSRDADELFKLAIDRAVKSEDKQAGHDLKLTLNAVMIFPKGERFDSIPIEVYKNRLDLIKWASFRLQDRQLHLNNAELFADHITKIILRKKRQ